MSQLNIYGFYACDIFFLYFPFLNFLSHSFNMGFNKNTRVCVDPSVYDAVKYFIETVTPRTFSKIFLSHSFLSNNSFCVNVLSKNFLLFVTSLTKSQSKTLLNIRNFACFLNRPCPIFLFLEIVLVY